MLANIVITTFNRLNFTKQTIPNIIDTASDSISYMITVVDNGSKDGTPEYLIELFNQKKITNLILLPENIGVAKGQNLGWKLFENVSIYGKVDNDVLFHKKNWLNEIIYILSNSSELGALGYNCEAKDCYSIIDNGAVKYRYKQGNIGGACHFIPRAAQDILGFWCEDYDKYGEEDADMGYRIVMAGLKNAYMIDENVMEHLPEPVTEYVEFKRKQRNDNLAGKWNQILTEYQSKQRPLRIETNVLNEISYTLMSNL